MLLSEKFIKATDDLCDFYHPVAAPYFRKEFNLDFIPENAEITICGLGFYELTVNGTDITKGFMAPYVSNHNHVCYYDNYDVTKLLTPGINVIGITLGNGMRNCYGGFVWEFEKGRAPLCLALALEIENKDRKMLIEADSTFKTADSPILYNDTRMGYTYDANLEIPGWNIAGFDDSDWKSAFPCETPAGEKCICTAEPLVNVGEVKAVDIKHYDKLPFAYESSRNDSKPIESTYRENVYVYDFGINYSGVTKLKINGKKGQKITVRHGELLQNGGFSISNIMFYNNMRDDCGDIYREFCQKDEFVCKGGEEEFVPKFKYDGFRYAFVEGLEPEQATKDALTYIKITSDIKPRASFNSSCDTLNKLYEMITVSDISNFCYFPTDCPHREKNGWTGDAHASCERFLLTLTAENSLKMWMRDIRKAQLDSGILPGIVPTFTWGYEWGNGPMWDAICTEIPYQVYRFTGNSEIIEENAQLILRYLSYVMGKRDEKGLIAIGLGDWVDPFAYEVDGEYKCPLEVTDTVMSYRIADTAQKLFEIIGKKNEASFAAACKNDLRTAIREHLIDFNTYTVYGNCQTAQAIVLYHGIFNDDEFNKAAERLVELIHSAGDINTCGLVGLRFIYHILTTIDEYDLAYKVITSEEFSCYGSWVKNGYTNMLESFPFETDKPFGPGGGVGSLNHHFLGDIGSWMIQEVAGIVPNPELKGVDTFIIAPHFLEALNFAEATFNAKYGDITVRWERTGDDITLKISVPDGMYGKLQLTGYTCDISELSGGSYTINCKKS